MKKVSSIKYQVSRGERCGFTLIELLVVISIIGILFTVSLVGFNEARKSARNSKRKADLEQIRSALEIYRNDLRTYPATGNLSSLETDYIAKLPADPTPSNYQYYYVLSSANKYYLCAYLEGGGTASGNCGANCGVGASAQCNYETSNP